MNANMEEEIIVRVTLYEYLIYSALLIQVLEFLSLKDIGNLDSSNTNYKWRPLYLMRLSQMKHSLFHIIQPKEAQTKWIIKRRIRVDELVFKMEVNEPQDNWFYTIGDFSLNKITLSLSEVIKYNYNNKSFTNISNRFLFNLGHGCGRLLNSVNLTNCNQISHEGVISLINNCPELEELNLGCRGRIDWFDEGIFNEKITDACFTEIGKKSHKLKIIDLTCCTNITDASIIEISKGCPLLHTINLSCCNNITDISIIEISNMCPLLNNIHLESCKKITDIGVIKLSKGCPLMHSIDLNCCLNITDASIIEISKGCPLLHTIYLGYCDITDRGIMELSRNCPLLQHVNLRDNQKITDASILAISKWCSLLQTINLYHCKITDMCIIELSKGCPLLHTINLDSCRNITDVSIIELSKGCSLLQKITLSSYENITDVSLIELGKRCPLLQIINIRYCQKITDAGIIAISKGCPLLQYIDLADCRNIKVRANDLINVCPLLQNINFCVMVNEI